MQYLPILSFISFLPLISQFWASIKTPEGMFFVGANTGSNFNDIVGVYFAAIRNFAESDWLYRNPYDAQSEPFFHYPIYLILGKISSIFSIGEVVIYFIACFILIFILLFSIFKFLQLYFNVPSTLFLAFGLSVFGGLFPYMVPEASALFSFWEPHFIAAQTALFVSLYFLIRLPLSTKPLRDLSCFALANFVLAAVHPWMLIFLGIFTIIWLSTLYFSKKNTKKIFLALVLEVLIGLPFLFYYGDSARVQWNSHPMLTMPYLLLQIYGFLLFFSFLGIYKLLRTQISLKVKFIIFWFVLQIFFIYLPFSFQRRFIEGFYLPVGILAVHGVEWLTRQFKWGKIRGVFYTFAFLFFSIGVIASYVYLFFWLPNNYIYRNVEEKEAWDFVAKKDGGLGRFLSLPLSSIVAVSRFDLNPYVGHDGQTPDFEYKVLMTINFYLGKTNSAERENFLRSEEICYVYLGFFERQSAKVDFENEQYLEKIFSKNSVEVYKPKWCK